MALISGCPRQTQINRLNRNDWPCASWPNDVLVTERLLAWTDGQIAEDLAAYDDVDPVEANEVRDMLLKWLKAST